MEREAGSIASQCSPKPSTNATTVSPRFDVTRDPRRFPGAGTSRCTASRSSISTTRRRRRSRGRCIDALRALLRARQRQRPSRRAHAERARDRRVRRRAREGARVHQRARRSREIIFTRNATESINLVARAWGDANVRAGRRGAHHGDGAPLEHRAVAAAVRADRRDAARRADRRSRRAASWTSSRGC